jgi:hypothetical protein
MMCAHEDMLGIIGMAMTAMWFANHNLARVSRNKMTHLQQFIVLTK